jgi:hypothetical protein
MVTVVAVTVGLGMFTACPATAPAAPRANSAGTSASTGAAARLERPHAAGAISEPASTTPFDLKAHGYVEQEYFASGTAQSYAAAGSLPTDGMWSVRPAGSAGFRTRIVVRRPSDPRRFNGTVLVEWFNVTGGLEADPEWSYVSTEILRAGYAYVGISAQALGINGGPALLGVPGGQSGGLRAAQPARYGSLVHPGDPYSFDIVSQVARALRSPGRVPVLGPLHPSRILAVGESQSAFFLTTYIDAVQPHARAFDGFLVHSRAGGSAALGGHPGVTGGPTGVRIRRDLGVPVLVFETETDVGPLLDYGPARQPDTSRFRLWEVAGTAHADAYLVGNVTSLLGCNFTINEGPEHFVAQAALHALDTWVRAGVPPAVAPRLELASTAPPRVARDSLGNALGGVRTPAVDAPVSALSGQAPTGASVLCSLFGSTTPFDAATMVRLYHDRSGYLAAFTRALDKAIGAGFLLRADRPSLMAQAEQFAFPS